MWIPKRVLPWLIAETENADTLKDAITYLREELGAVRAERDTLKTQLAVSQTHFDWLRLRVNVLENERIVMLEKATGIKMAAPAFVHTAAPDLKEQTFSFEDVGDLLATKFGLNDPN